MDDEKHKMIEFASFFVSFTVLIVEIIETIVSVYSNENISVTERIVFIIILSLVIIISGHCILKVLDLPKNNNNHKICCKCCLCCKDNDVCHFEEIYIRKKKKGKKSLFANTNEISSDDNKKEDERNE